MGTILTLVSITWVLWQLSQGYEHLQERLMGQSLLAAVLLASLLYAILLGLNAAAWWWLTAAYEQRAKLSAGLVIWARPQIAKYLPGNVFHYVGRQALGSEVGVGHATLVAAALLELLSIVLAAVALAAVGLAFSGNGGREELPLAAAAVVVILALFAWPLLEALARKAARWLPPLRNLPRLGLRRGVGLLAPALLLHGAFLVGSGSLLFLLVRVGWPGSSLGWHQVFWLYPLAWAAGTLTVGAPGGLGVREAILTMELQGSLGSADAAALALALRAVTLSGDLLATSAAWVATPAILSSSSRDALVDHVGQQGKERRVQTEKE